MAERRISNGRTIVFFTLLFAAITSQTVMAKSRVKISRPRKHMIFSDYKFRVKGKAKGIPEGTYLWICLQEQGKKQWKPQGDTIILKNGYFKTFAYVIFDGIDERSETTKLNVAIVGVNKAGNETFKKYMKENFKTDLYPYVNLPPDSKILVTRKIRYRVD